ncbi:hypothetical protein [Aeropyrum camini]|uniref:Uncharacterized protein n=1 Tax=Aeropyrum camini SY1 = JCM 12091 TaxID=1198449 RepID=U3TC15_9CREN|nr:hypothetical protein [Aeropyrum camini]BAN89488.1 hypothetical protein ACAM_0019 [Aeropyrum camini SY1 = JCM 12091]
MEARKEDVPKLERTKIYWAIAAAFITSGLVIILSIGVLTGALPIGPVFAISILAITLFATFFFMDLAWENWAVKGFALITVIVVLMMFANMIFGRALGP